MALLDRERNLIVIRVVYDGPPEAGKTTSLRALAGSLGQPLFSPAEQAGRTLYFDWMDYTGGRFEGYQIRCQIVSVPGQRELAARRARLLRDADVVVFVADSRRAALEPTLTLLGEVPATLAALPGPPVGLILQANKRDLADAVPLPELRARVQALGLQVGVVESVASDNTGIRESFVFAVRLALDRVREQLRTQTLASGPPSVDSGEALYAVLQEADRAAPAALLSLAAPALEQVLAENDVDEELEAYAPWRAGVRVGAAADAELWPPDPSAPSGAIWPPVEGRVILHEASTPRMTTHRLENGGWAAGLGSGWRAYSSGGAVYADLEAGREMLVRWARLHAACASVLSPSRCAVLAATGQGGWRLWQIVRAERSLRDHLDDIERIGTEEAARRILEAATLMCEMSVRVQHVGCHLPCTLDTIARGERGPVYIGLMPMERVPLPESGAIEPLGQELRAILGHELHERRADVLAALHRVRHTAHVPGTAGLSEQALGQMVGQLLEGAASPEQRAG